MSVPLLGSSYDAAYATAGDLDTGSVTESVSADIAFRASFGLEADPAVVVAAQTDPSYSREAYGVSLRKQELDDLRARLTVQQALGPAIDSVRNNDEFAGVYLDQLDGGRPVFMFTGSPESNLQSVESAIPSGTVFTVRQAEYTYRQLEAIRDDVQARVEELAAQGIIVVSVGPDDRQNAVRVGVSSWLQAAQDALSEYGTALYVEADAPGITDACSFSSCGNAKAGIKIYRSTTGAWCTNAALGKLNGGTIVSVTAGHCFHLNGGSGKSWNHDGALAGTSSGDTWFNGATADSGYLTIASGWLPSVKNKILLSDGATVGYITSYTLATSQIVGAQVCRTGGGTIANGGPRCGQIDLRDQDRVSCPPSDTDCTIPVIHHQWEVNFDSVGGDSGGPYYDPDPSNNVAFYGTHTHSTDPCISNCHGWYSPSDWIYSAIQDKMQVTILYYCVNSSCSAP